MKLDADVLGHCECVLDVSELEFEGHGAGDGLEELRVDEIVLVLVLDGEVWSSVRLRLSAMIDVRYYMLRTLRIVLLRLLQNGLSGFAVVHHYCATRRHEKNTEDALCLVRARPV